MKKKLLFISSYSAVIWLLCVIGVLGVITIATRFLTHDPDFSPGDPENIYLMPMLTFFFIGGFSFVVMVISAILSRFSEGVVEGYKPILGLSSKNSALLVGVLLFGAFSFLFGFRQANVGSYSQETGSVVTGQEIFNAINNNRQEKGLAKLELEPRICDNLVQRYLDIMNPDNKYIGHAGFEKWYEEQGLQEYELSEVYVSGIRSGAEAVKFWESSPGHKSAVEGNYKLACAYANQGVAVAVLGNKK